MEVRHVYREVNFAPDRMAMLATHVPAGLSL